MNAVEARDARRIAEIRRFAARVDGGGEKVAQKYPREFPRVLGEILIGEVLYPAGAIATRYKKAEVNVAADREPAPLLLFGLLGKALLELGNPVLERLDPVGVLWRLLRRSLLFLLLRWSSFLWWNGLLRWSSLLPWRFLCCVGCRQRRWQDKQSGKSYEVP